MDNVSGVLIRFKDQFLTFTNVPGIKIGVIDIIEILIISVLFYHILLWIKTTRAWNLFKGLIIILLFVLVAALFQMDTILWLAEKLFNIGLVALVVIFQPELRNALENIGGKTFWVISSIPAEARLRNSPTGQSMSWCVHALRWAE